MVKSCTIIIPAFNAAPFIAEAIESARAQGTAEDIQIIVVDDGSADATTSIVREFVEVELVEQENGGPAAARNTGLVRAESDYVIFLDADDTLLPGALDAHLRAMADNPEAVMVFGASNLVDARGCLTVTRNLDGFVTHDTFRIAYGVTPCPSQCLFRRAPLEQLGGYDLSFRSNEDVDLLLRISSMGSIVCHETVVMNYRLHAGQATKRPSRLVQSHLRALQMQFGEGGRSANPAKMIELRKRWQQYYGQYIPTECIRLLVNGKVSEAWRAGAVFLAMLPDSAQGALSFGARRIGAKLRVLSRLQGAG